MALGMILFVPSANTGSFPVFLAALFVGGIGNTLLQAAVNPYVTIVGPHESAAMRMCLMGIMNKLAWWLGPVFLGLFLDLKNVHLSQVSLPFYIVTGILLLLAVFIKFSPLPEVKAEGEDEDVVESKSDSYAAGKTSIFQMPHLLLGALALFFYVGVETLPMASIIGFAKAVFGETLPIQKDTQICSYRHVCGICFRCTHDSTNNIANQSASIIHPDRIGSLFLRYFTSRRDGYIWFNCHWFCKFHYVGSYLAFGHC